MLYCFVTWDTRRPTHPVAPSGYPVYGPGHESFCPATLRQSYPSDLTDAQWALVEPFVRGNSFGPQPTVHSRREVLNAVLYVT